MGSLEHNEGASLPPPTRLPLFNTTFHTSGVRSYHKATSRAVAVVHDKQILLQRFALFVKALTGSSETTFVDDTGCSQTLIHAFSLDESVELVKVPHDDSGLTLLNSDFAMRTTTIPDNDANNVCRPHLPLVLEICSSGDPNVADVTLHIRGDHGPEAAAQHLLKLAIAFISPEICLNKTDISYISTPSPLFDTQENGQQQQPAVLHSILEDSARLYPYNIAIDEITGGHEQSYARRELTYAELQAKVSAWADQVDYLLQKLDWPTFEGEQRMVPIFMPSSSELNICMNGISKAGHCFCTLQLDAPETRLRDLLSDLNAPGILGVGSNPWAGTQFGEDIVWIDYLNPTSCLEGRTGVVDGPLRPRRAPTADDLAYIIYTSGSTGKPKGVRLVHRIAVAYIRAFDASPGGLPTGPRLRWMAMCQPSFDLVLMDNFMALFKGGTVCLATRDLMLTNPEAVINELRATATYTVVSLALLLRPERMPTLSTLCTGGEAVVQRVIDNYAPQTLGGGGRRLLNVYGPAETTVLMSIEVCDSGSRPSVIGAPFPGSQFVVLEEDTTDIRAVPLGVAGELAISGPQLSPGYHNRPKETARAFVHDAKFGPLYRSGDRGRVVWSEDGEPKIEFLGRTSSDQVKLNGRRVELPEIENVVSRAESASQAAVFVHNAKLLACVKPLEGAWDAATVEQQCRAEAERLLPAWMRPMEYVIMAEFPHNANGKFDRKALKATLLQPKPGANGNTVAQASPAVPTVPDKKDIEKPKIPVFADTEALVYEGLSDALGERVQGQTQSATLSSVGLDSLRAVVFLQKLRELGIKELEIHEVLSSATIGDLITVAEAQRKREGKNGSVTKAPPNGNTGATNGHSVTNGHTTNDPSESDHSKNGYATNGHTTSRHADGVDVSTVAADDADAVYDMPTAAKILHFDYHCRELCLKALNLPSHLVEQVLPATNVQSRFVAMAVDPTSFDSKRCQGRPHVEHFVYQVPDEVDPARLQRAVDTVMPRYDCYRTVFVPVEHPLSPFAQCVLSPSVRKIPKVEIICDDADADCPATRSSLWREAVHGAQRMAENSMSMDRPGVVVSWVWSTDRARCVWILSLFHGVYDGTQLTYLRDAVMAEYTRPGCKPPVDLLPVRTAVELNLAHDWVQTLIYWAGRFTGVPGCRLGSRRPEPVTTVPSYVGVEETHMRILNAKSSLTMRELDEAAAAMSTTMLTVAEVAWASVLAQTFSESARSAAAAGKTPLDVQFGSVMGGRRHRDALRCMAPMLAALPMRLLIDGTKPLTNRRTCEFLMEQRHEAQPHLQIPCPTMAHAKMGENRIDTVLLVQALLPEGSHNVPRELPGYNIEENLLAPYKEIHTGYPLVSELWPGRQKWDEKMVMRLTYDAQRPGYEFLTRDWVLGALSAMDEAIVRIVSEPDAQFYMG